MISEIDETCKTILLALLEGPKDYADLQRAIDAGSQQTAKNHIKKHLEPRLVAIKKKIKGRRNYYSIELTEKGRETCKTLQGGRGEQERKK
jgi:DNA-binding HxlR family transcriptional regulator